MTWSLSATATATNATEPGPSQLYSRALQEFLARHAPDQDTRPSAENARRVMDALQAFGAPLHGMTIEDLADVHALKMQDT